MYVWRRWRCEGIIGFKGSLTYFLFSFFFSLSFSFGFAVLAVRSTEAVRRWSAGILWRIGLFRYRSRLRWRWFGFLTRRTLVGSGGCDIFRFFFLSQFISLPWTDWNRISTGKKWQLFDTGWLFSYRLLLFVFSVVESYNYRSLYVTSYFL